MKKNRWFKTGILIALLLVAGLLVRFTGLVQVYRIHAGTNDPAMVSGRKAFISSLLRPERKKFIVYRQDSSHYWSGGLWLMRIVGMPGDTVQMINGDLFVNHRNADDGMNIKQEYIVPARELLKISPDFYQSHAAEIIPFTGDSADAALESKQVAAYKIQGRRVLYNQPDVLISHQYGQPWNADQFGPVIVPADSFFVLGDNRHHAKDSRYTRYVGKDKVVGVVFWGERK